MPDEFRRHYHHLARFGMSEEEMDRYIRNYRGALAALLANIKRRYSEPIRAVDNFGKFANAAPSDSADLIEYSDTYLKISFNQNAGR